MPRPVNEEQHRQRRLVIIDAALTCFAESGFDGATTAEICRTAGIGSGTFFHYFPTKVDAMVAILELGAEEVADFFRSQAAGKDPAEALLAYVDHEAANVRDQRAAGFIRAVVVAANHERVATALAEHQRVVRAGLTPWVRRARKQQAIRSDISVERTVSWILAIVDGFGSQVADWPAFDARRENPLLRDLVRRFLRP